jgi:hypothetical protein
MATQKDYQNLYDRIAALRDQVTSRLAPDLISNPQLADALTKQIDDMLKSVVDADTKAPPPPDKGLAELAGIGPQAATEFGTARIPAGVEPYDDNGSQSNHRRGAGQGLLHGRPAVRYHSRHLHAIRDQHC